MRLVSLFVFSLLLSGCAISIPDVWVCSELSQTKAFCTKTISDEEGVIEGQNWANIKSTSLIIPHESWAELKAYILKQCEKNKDCKRPKALSRSLDIQNKLYE